MITTRLQGGCGNQLWQYAFGLTQARRFHTDLQIDISSYKFDPKREYNLCLFPRITEKIVVNSQTTIQEKGMPYNPSLIDSIKDGDVLNGYWQSEKYLESIEYDIRWRFQPGPLSLKQQMWFRIIFESKNPTFLTVRRTDYVGNSFHGEMSESYYWEALKIIAEKTGRPSIFVFTDDIEWCQNNLNLPWPFQIAGTYDRTVKGHLGREDADLFLMSLCRNAVMANSSFSWWGAWLGDNLRKGNNGVVVAPKTWFGPTAHEDVRDIVPDRWLTI